MVSTRMKVRKEKDVKGRVDRKRRVRTEVM